MELTRVNLSRSRNLWPENLRRESCDWAQLRNFRSHMSNMSSSVEIVNLVKTWLGFPYICQIFHENSMEKVRLFRAQRAAATQKEGRTTRARKRKQAQVGQAQERLGMEEQAQAAETETGATPDEEGLAVFSLSNERAGPKDRKYDPSRSHYK
jgi:hypothetical protein